MYGTSMVVAGGHGLGEAQDTGFDWNKMFSDALSTGVSIYTSQQDEQRREAQRRFEIQMAKITGTAAVNKANEGGDGETTQDGLFGGSGKTVGLIVGGAVLLGGIYLVTRKKRR